MRIGILLRHFEQQGGIGTYTRNLLEHLLKLDRQNDYVLMYANPDLIGTYAGSPRVVEVAVRARSNLLWDQWTVPALVRRHRLDLVFNPKLSVPLFSDCKKVFCMHGGEWFVFPHNYSWAFRAYHRLFAPLYAGAADAIVAVSKTAGRDITSALRLSNSKVRAIYHGVPPTFHRDQDPAHLQDVRR